MGRRDIQYVQLEPGAFIADTEFQMMTAEERGVYWSVILYLYANGGKLVLASDENDSFLGTNHKQIATLSNCFKAGQDWEQIWNKVKTKFKIKGSVLTHKRVTQELRRAAKYRRNKSLAGKKGMQQRYNTVTSGVTTKKSKVKIRKEESNKEEKSTFTLQNFIDEGCLAGLTQQEAELCYGHYKTQRWKYGNNLEIPSVADAVTRWRLNRPRFAGQGKGGAEKKCLRCDARGVADRGPDDTGQMYYLCPLHAPIS